MIGKYKYYIISIYIIASAFTNVFAQQISISKIDNMPDLPQPYLMRDWKDVAIKYDSLVFNLNLSGTYLPLIWTDYNGTNYSGQRFGLHSVVGTNSPTSAEAINCIPAIVGATLAGIDKSNQNGDNWVEMCQEWFNKNNGLMVYKNHSDDQTSDDWWYETMPNIFFYQLYSLYPNTGDFNNQFISVADQFLKSVIIMGGSTTPWKLPNMNYQGFDFSTMTPSALHEHNEPEAAGATAWILYNAYKVTGDSKYRVGAELAMEYLNSLSANPSYELQLYYGVYLAARMNAEIGTNYNVTKMLNWCFTDDNIRNWGVMNGKWGGYDVDGLIGEINSDINSGGNYPFTMNTFEQIGTLVPMVRYNDRYANAIGKLILNAANAARLFYPGYLPSANQDAASKQWADQYDTGSYIAHESMHQYKPKNSSISPYATGDAVSGGWGQTNLALYGSSHVGILGGIIDTTNVTGILKLDLLKTDYFHDNAYPTYLFYNPNPTEESINLNVENGPKDIYETTANSFLANNVSGITQITIPSKSAIVIVEVPSGGVQSYNENKFLVNGTIVDYSSGQPVTNYPPRIKSLSAEKNEIIEGDSVAVYCTAVDKDKDVINYSWNSSNGIIQGNGSQILWIAPADTGNNTIKVIIDDGKGGKDSTSINIRVVKIINNPPVISNLTASPGKLSLGKNSVIYCFANDSNNDQLTYSWSSSDGLISGSDSVITWTAPNSQGIFYVVCSVSDGNGGTVRDSIGLEVRDLSNYPTGNLICYYPFSGNANDESGNNFNGVAYDVVPSTDRKGNANNAYLFNGTTSSVYVPNNNSLNFQNYITINFWMKINQSFSREQYPISHGSWENRWKVSISNGRLRWTIKTNNGVTDLDSKTQPILDSLYNVTVLYDGSYVEIYFNGELDAFKQWSGNISQTSYGLTIGQYLPGDNNYNFSGILDEIRIFDYPLKPDSIKQYYDITTGLQESTGTTIPVTSMIYQNYPNPFNGQTNIKFQINTQSHVRLEIFNVIGQRIAVLLDENKSPGYYNFHWDAKDSNGNKLSSGVYLIRLNTGNYSFTKKMVLLN
jgi:hypothetical protein